MADWIKSVTMDLFFDMIGQAAVGNGSCAVVTSFKLGYGWVDETGDTPVLSDLTGTETDIPGIIFTGTKLDGDMIVNYSGGVLMCQCIVDQGSISQPEKVSCIGIYDQENNIMAAAVFYPDWITPDEEYRINVYLNFPTSGA